MYNIFKNFFNNYNISQKSLLVAFSGGYDSTVLLDILLKLRTKYDFKLATIHLNHNWRGEESDKEEIFCKNFCQKHSIQFFSKKLDKGSTTNELEAREARYNFFEEIYKKHNFDYLLTAHTKSDNAETIIFRITHGTGINGLKGIGSEVEYKNMKILRPMLDISREDIENYIKENNLAVNFDSSNKNKKYKRNKIRLDVIPHLKELCPTFEENANHISQIANFYDTAIDYFLTDILKDKHVCTKKFLEFPYEIQHIILYKFLLSNNIEINFEQIKLLLEQIKSDLPKSGKYFSISKDKFVLIRKNKFEIIQKKENNINEYSFKISEVSKEIKNFPDGTKNYIYADKKFLTQPLTLRKRQEGDTFRPFGLNGTMKLKKFLNLKEVPKFERDNLILLTNSQNEILWIYPLATSDLIKVKDKKNIVRIELTNE